MNGTLEYIWLLTDEQLEGYIEQYKGNVPKDVTPALNDYITPHVRLASAASIVAAYNGHLTAEDERYPKMNYFDNLYLSLDGASKYRLLLEADMIGGVGYNPNNPDFFRIIKRILDRYIEIVDGLGPKGLGSRYISPIRRESDKTYKISIMGDRLKYSVFRVPEYAFVHGIDQDFWDEVEMLLTDDVVRGDKLLGIDNLDWYDPDILEVLNFDVVINKLKSRPFGLERGDIIQLSKETYRNDGTFIYDGLKIKGLADEPDDYGTVPSDFLTPSQFTPDYWRGRIDHNLYVWLEPAYIDVFLGNIKSGKPSDIFPEGTYPSDRKDDNIEYSEAMGVNPQTGESTKYTVYAYIDELTESLKDELEKYKREYPEGKKTSFQYNDYFSNVIGINDY